jgi:glycosyltransferase involved in cell wall biosynthesis
VALVSIIIPVYNADRLIAATIESALSQNYESIEIIIVDDGATDNSFFVAKNYEGEKLKIIRQINAGASIARNTGLQQAKGEYIQFLDAGDLLSEEKISRQVEVLRGQKNKLAVCDYRQFENEEDLQQPLSPNQTGFIYSTEQPIDFLVNLWGGNGESNFIQTNCWLVPRQLIEKAGAWRPYRCPDDDGEFFTRVILASEGIIYVPDVYNYFRVGAGSNQLSGNKSRKYLKNTLLTIDLKNKYLMQKGGHPKLNAALAKQYLDYAVYHFPAQKDLSALAYRRYRQLGINAEAPLLGGRLVEGLKSLLGWRAVRLLQYYLRERFR